MHSFVARLRGRAVSQTTTVSSHSETLPDTPDTPTFTHSLHDFSDAHTPVISRRILPQVHELLESYSTEDHLPDTHPADELQSGLSPRPVKHNIRPSSVSSNVDASNERSESRSASPSTSVNIGKGSFARISRRLATTPWSTFGRTTTPKVSQLDHAPTSKRFHFGSVDTFAAPRASQSSTSLANYAAGSSVSHNRSRRPSHTSEGSSWKNESSHRRSPSLSTIVQDLHSSSPPGTSSGITSVKGPSPTHSSPSSKSQVFSAHTHVLSNLNMHSGSSSHQTFGPTSTSIHPSAFVTPTTTPIPEVDTNASLPNLASPLQAILCDKSNETTDPPPLRHWTSSLHAKTFPMRQRSKTVSSGKPDENTVPFPASGRRLRSYTSAPAVRHIFLQRPPSTPKLGGRRPSTKSSRRSSADWSAQQATAGVAFNAVGEYGWPAQVSREIIRMSLGDLDAPQLRHSATGKRHDRQSANADITKRGHNVPHASEVAGRPCTSLPSPNSLPHNTEGEPESGDKSSWHSGVQDDNPVSRKSGGVVEGQRSMSTRNGVELSTLKEEGDDVRQSATLPRAATGSRGYRKSILRHSSSLNQQSPEAGPSSLESAPTSASTPKTSRRTSLRRPSRHASEPIMNQDPETPTSNKGKRKAEDVDITPPDPRLAQHATFVIPADHRRTHHQSEPSRAPSAYQHKRVRLSSQSPTPSPSHSRPGSSQQNGPNVTGSPPRRTTTNPSASPALRAVSRAASTRSIQPSVTSAAPPSAPESRRDRRRSLSEISIPIGAIVSPQPPSLSRSSTYHMRDPRRPPRVHSTPWTPHRKSEDEEASPIHAWIFYISFVLFPLWWIASFLPIPRTRHVGGSDTEKAVPLDDPQIEHDARSWRYRCRIMACVSFLTYIPFIVLVAVFASR